MTGRERVRLALEHRETDRVPADFLATRETWAKLQAHLGCRSREDVLWRLGADLRHPRQPYIGPPLEVSGGELCDAWGVRRRPTQYNGGIYNEICWNPLAGTRDAGELERYPWPQPEWWDPEALKESVQALDAEGDYAIALPEFGDPGGIFEIAWYMRGMERFMLDFAEAPDIAHGILTRICDFFVRMLDRVMAALGERVDLIWTSDDIAHQRGRLMSERTWRQFVAPYHERFNRRAHEWGVKVMYHCCGAVRPFIPGLIEIGTDVLDVLQFSARGMDPCEIKSSFGGCLCFHGGMDVQSTLPFASPEDVRREAHERIEVMGRDGGYILSPSHNIQIDTPAANIVAMYEEAGSLRR